jgi:citrate lyase subunit beta/citryl-CoA lyase
VTRVKAAQDATSWLVVQGNRPDQFGKVSLSGAQEVICALEHAVREAGKRAARRYVARWLSRGGTDWARVNAWSTPYYVPDMAELAGLRACVAPKAKTSHLPEAGRHWLGCHIGVIALIETAGGLRRGYDIAFSEAATWPAFVSIDFVNDIGVSMDEEALLARATMVIASRTARKLAGIDGGTAACDRRKAVAGDASRARGGGFGGKLWIHPAQMTVVTTAFSPTAAETRWVRDHRCRTGTDGRGRRPNKRPDDRSASHRPCVPDLGPRQSKSRSGSGA